MPHTQRADTKIYYEVHGHGEPLLLIMGYGSNSGHWFAILNRLAGRYRTIIFDNRGTGRSDKPDLAYTAEMKLGDMITLLDELGIERTNVFGVSMGGMLAQEFALNHPDRVKNLVLGCTSCGAPHSIPNTPEAREFLFNPDVARLTNEEKALATIPWLWRKDFIDENPDAVKRYVAATAGHPTPPHAYACQANFLILFDSYDRLHQITAPTLVITGDQDRLIPPENSRLLASLIPGAELAIIRNAGHGFIADSAEESSRIILDFLDRHR